MPISSSAVVGEFAPTPFETHKTKSGEPIESVRPDSSFNLTQTDLSTVENIPSNQSSKALKYGVAILLTVAVCAAVAIPVGIIFSKSTYSTTQSTILTTLTTGTTITTTTGNATSALTTTSTSTSTTGTTTTSTTSTTATTTTTGTSFACPSNETIYGVWNTTAGRDSTPATSGSNIGNYYPTEYPQYACNNNVNDKYTNFGGCSSSGNTLACGINTGFYRTPQRGSSLIIGLQICTPGSANTRDPLTITFEGSNQPTSSLNLGSSWNLIYNGSSGLATDPGRLACGTPVLFPYNTVWYSSYRFLVTSKRGLDSSTWYSEIQLFGY